MKPSATVQLPISAFRDRVRDFDGNDAGLAVWIRNFSKALSETDPEIEGFAGLLLGEVATYRKKEALRIQALYKEKKSNGNKDQEQFPVDADPGDNTSNATSEMVSRAPASTTFDGAAGSRGKTPEDSSPREDVQESLPPQQPPAAKPRRPSSSTRTPSSEDVYDFAHLQGLDDLLTREWYEMTSDRSWTTRDGEVIRNWKGMLTKYVRARVRKLNQEE